MKTPKNVEQVVDVNFNLKENYGGENSVAKKTDENVHEQDAI